MDTMTAVSTNPGIAAWDQRFATDDYLFGTAPNAFLRQQQPLLQPGQTVLAVADGEGRNGVWLAQQGLRVTSVEGSANALKKARALAQSANVDVDWIEADLLSWQWPVAAYDIVAAIFIQFLDPAQRQRVFAAMRAALKPGGLLLVQGYTPRQLAHKTGGPSQLEQLYTRELLEELTAGMRIERLDEYEAVLTEGSAHHGMSAVIDLVARRTE